MVAQESAHGRVHYVCMEEFALPGHDIVCYRTRAHTSRGVGLHALEVAHQSPARRCRHCGGVLLFAQIQRSATMTVPLLVRKCSLRWSGRSEFSALVLL